MNYFLARFFRTTNCRKCIKYILTMIINEFEHRLSELLPNDVSKRDITLLFLTSLISAIQNGENLEDLIQSIKSKGGTTEAGLTHLYEKDFINIFSEAINAAKNRAANLSMD